MSSTRKAVVHQPYPPRTSTEPVSSSYSRSSTTSSNYYPSSNMSSTTQNTTPMYCYEAPASQPTKDAAYGGYEAAQSSNGTYAAQAGSNGYTSTTLQRTTHPTGMRHGKAGGPPENPHGYYVKRYDTPGRTPLTVHEYGAYRGPEEGTQYAAKRS